MNQDQQLDENKLIAQRREKLTAPRERGSPFPNDFRRNVVSGELHGAEWRKDAEDPLGLRAPGCRTPHEPSRHGKASFAHLQDMSGRIQLFVQRDLLGSDAYAWFKRELDIGDIVGAEGTLFKTRTGSCRSRLSLCACSPSPEPRRRSFTVSRTRRAATASAAPTHHPASGRDNAGGSGSPGP